MAASLPSLRVMLVCSTMVVRPLCSGTQTARAVSPLGTAAKKLVLLSMVAVRPLLGRRDARGHAAEGVAQAITAPPCMTPRRLHRSSRTVSSASVRSAVRWSTFTPRSLVKGGTSGRAIGVTLLLAMPVHSTAGAGRQRAAARAAPLERAWPVGGSTGACVGSAVLVAGGGPIVRSHLELGGVFAKRRVGARSSAG